MDEVVPEPLGGAHTAPEASAELLKQALLKELEQLLALSPKARLKQRYAKFRNFGRVMENPPALASKPAEAPQK